MSETTIGELLHTARQRLAAAPFEAPRREALLLLAHVLKRGEASILAHPEEPVPAPAQARFSDLLTRRLTGEPVAYLFGEREFYGRPFTVDPRVLIPRPETEHLIEAALSLSLPSHPRIADAGTGSGAIAVTLALELPTARLLATDISLEALQVARANARRHGVAGRVTQAAVDLISSIHLAKVDLVVSNPPYIDPAVAAELSTEVTAFEPHLALFAPDRGRAVIERLLGEAATLPAGAYMIMEIGHDQSEWLEALVKTNSTWQLHRFVSDYGDIRRTAVLRRRHKD